MMPLTNTLQQTTLFSSNDFTMPEHFGDDRWTILHGDVMHIVPHMTRAVFDAVITDPPYASGGASQTAKNRSTTEKYSSLRGDKALPDFDSDQMDQRSWTQWMCEWLQMVRTACKPGAPICLFIDWRQLPSMTDALQWAGWTWRGIAVWDKPSGRPQRGRFRQQAEFIVWGSNGKMPLERNVGCLPGGPNPRPVCRFRHHHFGGGPGRLRSGGHRAHRRLLPAWYSACEAGTRIPKVNHAMIHFS